MLGTIKTDVNEAYKTDRAISINESGAYTGRITQAEQFDTANGATMARFRFATPDGRVTFVSLCLVASNGNTPFSYGIFQAILALLKVPAVSAVAARCVQPGGSIVDSYRMREMEGKDIGFVLEAETREYFKQGEQKTATNMSIRCVFDPQTRQTITERDKNQPAKRVDAETARLAAKAKNPPAPRAAGAGFESAPRHAAPAAAQPAAPQPDAAADYDPNDVPF